MDWSVHFPDVDFKKTGKKVEILDVGCGFGGLLIALSTVYPDLLILGVLYWLGFLSYFRQVWKSVCK